MLLYEIPGRDNIEIENIVFDYNGTILTADIYGTAEKECEDIKGKTWFSLFQFI